MFANTVINVEKSADNDSRNLFSTNLLQEIAAHDFQNGCTAAHPCLGRADSGIHLLGGITTIVLVFNNIRTFYTLDHFLLHVSDNMLFFILRNFL